MILLHGVQTRGAGGSVTCFPVHRRSGLMMAGGSSLILPRLSVSPLYTSSVYWNLLKKQPRMVILVPDTMWSWISPARGLPSWTDGGVAPETFFYFCVLTTCYIPIIIIIIIIPIHYKPKVWNYLAKKALLKDLFSCILHNSICACSYF